MFFYKLKRFICLFQINSDKMTTQIDKTITQLQIIDKKLEKLQTLSNRPKALRLYEPRIQKVYVYCIH